MKPKEKHEPIPRLSAWRWALELHVTPNKIITALKRANVPRQPRGKYSFCQIVEALNALKTPLEKEAERAQYQRTIDEAEAMHEKLLEQRRTLVPTADVKNFWAKVSSHLKHFARRAQLTKTQQQQLLAIADMTFDRFLEERSGR